MGLLPRPGGAGPREIARGWRWGGRTLVPASAEAHRPVATSREFPTAWARTPVARAARAAVQDYGLNPLLKSQLSPSVHGVDALGALDGPAIFVANHASHLDTALLLCALPSDLREHTAVAAAADYFFGSWWLAVGTALVFGTVPIERRGGAPANAPADLLAAGWNLVIYPEGTRSIDGHTRRFRFGAAALSIHHKVPIVPVAIRGTYAAMPRGRSWPIPGRPPVSVRFGRPITAGPEEDLRAYTTRVAGAVARLVDEGATDWWTSLRARPEEVPAGSRPAPVAHWRRVWESTEPDAPRGPRSPWD